MKRSTVAGLLLLGALLPSWAASQGIGDAAAREKAKREKGTKAAKPEGAPKYTDQDLEAGRPAGSSKKKGESSAPAAAPAESSGGSEASSDDRRERLRREAAPDAALVEQAEARVSAAEARVAELRDKLNPMSGSFIYGASGSNSPNEEAQVRAELTQADQALAQARAQLDAAKAAQAAESGDKGAEKPH